MRNEIPQKEDENLIDFLLYRLYVFYRPNSVPSHIRQNFGPICSNTIDDIISFFEKFISENDELSTLENIKENFKDIFFAHKHGRNGNIETIGKYLLSLLEKKIISQKEQEQIKNRMKNILILSSKKNTIPLQDGISDFDMWSEIYERYIVSLNSILHFPALQKYHFIHTYHHSFLPERRKSIHVFMKVEHFFEYFHVENFYHQLSTMLENIGPEEQKKILAILKEYLCRFETPDNKKYSCLSLQEKIFSKM